MAEFALGLTKTAVAGTLSRVKSAIEEEAEIKERVQEDLEFITGEFQMMQSFLRGANTAERAAKNQVVRTWVKQLRDLAFDVEDSVDFIVHLDSPPWTNYLWRMVPSCCKAGAPRLPLDEAVAEIKRLKTRVQDVSQRNKRYNLVIDSTAKADQPIMLPPLTTTTAASSSAAAFHILTEVWQAAGKLHSTGTCLKDLLTSAQGNELQVVSLWPGSHSAGADLHLSEVSCLIMDAYDDPEIYSEFECRAWVKLAVSHPAAGFNTQDFLDSLIAQFCPNFSTRHLAAADSKAELMQLFNTKRYLLVIQGISTVVEWYAIKMYLPDNNNGSRIIVSTQQLRTALFCTGDPYKVSEVTRFSDGQSLYAFSKVSVLRRDIGEFIWQIRRGGVISVLGYLRDRYSHEIFLLYKMVMYKHTDLDGVLVFKVQSWVDVPDPFDLEAFCVQLFLNFQSCDFQAKEIAAVGLKGVAERCRKYLAEGDCLVVINGLQSKDHWDMIKETLLLSGEPMAKGTSIVVITKDASVAAHCADQQNRSFNMEDVQEDMALSRLTEDPDCGIGGKEDSRRIHLLFHDPFYEYRWNVKFKLLGRENEVSSLERQIKEPGVISVWGDPGVGKSVIVKKVYYKQLDNTALSGDENALTDFSWVDMPDRPLDLTDFSWHLLLGFYSRDVNAKERAGVAMLRGQNPIQECCRLLRQRKCLVVIDGLRSEPDWDEIKDTFLSSEPATTLRGCIVVITDKQRVATHCVIDEQEGRVLQVKRLRALRRPLTKAPPDHTYERGEEACGWAAEFNLVGRDEEKEKLIYEKTGVHSLWGVAGVGKSALVRAVCHKCLSTYGRSIKHSWVDVPDPFDLSEFSQRLLLGFHSNDLQAKEIAAVSIMEGHDTTHGCCKIMRENACLIVIDGLRSTHDWDLIRAAFLPGTNQGHHRIIVVTNEASIAMNCVDDKRNVLNLKGLNDTDALRLFRKVAWCGKKKLTHDERDFSKAIVAKCGGLPEVIAALGEYTAKIIDFMGKNDETSRRIAAEIHHDFMGKLETDSQFQSLRGLFCWMQSYFDACPDSLKPCIFYLSVFPVGHNIRRRRLLRRWISEGYCTDTSFGVTAEDNGEMLFAELIKSSIIQQQQQTPSNSGNNKKIVIQVNGFYHGYIISRPMEDNLVFALEERCSINLQRVGQHLTIRSSWDGDEIVFKSMDFSRLRSLTVFGKWRSFFISKDINMRLLRVLDLEDTDSGVTDDVVEQIGKVLPRLKFLSLRGCKEITRIPDSFGGLRQLQTLDVRNTNIATLPHAIVKLVKLQYVRAGTSHQMVDEGGDVGQPASDKDECTSISSEDSLSSTEDSLSSTEESDDTVAGLATDSDDTRTNQPPPAIGVDGMRTSQPITAGDDGTSQPTVGAADCNDTRHPPLAADGVGTSTNQAVVAGDDKSTSQLLVAAGDDGVMTSQPAATTACGDGSSRRQPAVDEDRASTTHGPWRSKAHDVVVSYSCSWLSKKKKKSHHNNMNGGVEIPAPAVGKLTALHTLGVINVSGTRGKDVLKELQKLTQLHKLGVSGINRKKMKDLCLAISGHGHLESFSVRLDKDEDAASFFCSSEEHMFPGVPKTLKSLKLYRWDGHGTVQVSPVLVKDLVDLRKTNFELKLSTQEDFDSFSGLPHRGVFHVCVKPIQDGELRYDCINGGPILKIDCGSYKLAIVFGPYTVWNVEVLVVQCSSTESSLELSGLESLLCLKEVTLKGSYSEAVKQHLQQQVDKHINGPVLMFEDRESHQSPEAKGPAAAPCACCHTYASRCFNGMISTCK